MGVSDFGCANSWRGGEWWINPSSDCYGGHPLSRSSNSQDFRTGGYDRFDDAIGTISTCVRGLTDNPQMYNIAIGRYFTYRDIIPLIRWETISDSSDSHYESYVTGNPSILPMRSS